MDIDIVDSMDNMVSVYDDMDNKDKVVVHLSKLIGYNQWMDLRDLYKIVPWKYPLSLSLYLMSKLL